MIDDRLDSCHKDKTHHQRSDELRCNRQTPGRHLSVAERQTVHRVQRRRRELRHQRLPHEHGERVADHRSGDVDGSASDNFLDAAVEEHVRHDVRQRVRRRLTTADDKTVQQTDDKCSCQTVTAAVDLEDVHVSHVDAVLFDCCQKIVDDRLVLVVDGEADKQTGYPAEHEKQRIVDEELVRSEILHYLELVALVEFRRHLNENTRTIILVRVVLTR